MRSEPVCRIGWMYDTNSRHGVWHSDLCFQCLCLWRAQSEVCEVAANSRNVNGPRLDGSRGRDARSIFTWESDVSSQVSVVREWLTSAVLVVNGVGRERRWKFPSPRRQSVEVSTNIPLLTVPKEKASWSLECQPAPNWNPFEDKTFWWDWTRSRRLRAARLGAGSAGSSAPGRCQQVEGPPKPLKGAMPVALDVIGGRCSDSRRLPSIHLRPPSSTRPSWLANSLLSPGQISPSLPATAHDGHDFGTQSRLPTPALLAKPTAQGIAASLPSMDRGEPVPR